MGKRLPLVMGLPDPIGVNWMDQVEKVVSTWVIKATRISRAELRLVALPNPNREKFLAKRAERIKLKAAEAAK